MKIARERNPYLKRILANQPHKYSYDLESGRHYLHVESGKQIQINQTGTLKPKYKHYFTGFANHKQRYQEAVKQPHLMHFVPDMSVDRSKSFYTPMPDKFAGYSQYPYKVKKQFPEHLSKPFQAASKAVMMRKCQSEHKRQVKSTKKNLNSNMSAILQHSATSFVNRDERDRFFSMSFTSMTETKPLPKKAKRSCYNYKCKNLKYFSFDEKSKVEESTKYSENSTLGQTLGKSFHDSFLKMEGQESKLIEQQMC